MRTRETSPERAAARAILETMPGWRFLEPERRERLLERNAAALGAAIAKQRAVKEGARLRAATVARDAQ